VPGGDGHQAAVAVTGEEPGCGLLAVGVVGAEYLHGRAVQQSLLFGV
jgi:hypothetical protein